MTEPNTDEFGSKKITPVNWQEPDEQAALWRQMSRNIISSTDAGRWEATRQLRNSSSHPKYRAIFDPGQAEGMMSSVVESLNELFP